MTPPLSLHAQATAPSPAVATSSSGTSSPRNQYLDVCKGVLILLVVWGHLIQRYGYLDFGFYENPIFKAIYIFHMPLFIAISGYFSFHSIRKTSFPGILSRRFRQLIIPAFAWAAIFQLGLSLKALLSDTADLHATLAHFPSAVFQAVHSYWFLWAVLLGSVICALLKHFRRDNILFMVLACVAYDLIPGLGKDYLFKFTFPFFCLGYQVARLGFPSVFRRLWVTAAAGVASIGIYLVWHREDYCYVSQMSLRGHGVAIILFELAAGIVVSLFFLKLLSLVHSPRFLSPFAWFGRRSLEIYILHPLVLTVFAAPATSAADPLLFSLITAPLLALILCPFCAALGELPSLLRQRFERPTS